MNLEFEIPKIKNDSLLEELAKKLLETNYSVTEVKINGRSGQKQCGVDVYGKKNSEWIGIQCKVRSTNKSFSKKELLCEVNQAKNFTPRLSKYYIYTTLNRDVNTQTFEREISDELKEENSFTFGIKFWEDIECMLKKDKNKNVLHHFYSYLFFKHEKQINNEVEKIKIWIENDIHNLDSTPMYIYLADENYDFQGIIFVISVSIKNLTTSKITIVSWLFEVPDLNIEINNLFKKTLINVFPYGVLGLKKNSIEEANGTISIEPMSLKSNILLRFNLPLNEKPDIKDNINTILRAKTLEGVDIQCECILENASNHLIGEKND